MEPKTVILITETAEMKNILTEAVTALPIDAEKFETHAIEEGLPEKLNGQAVILSPAVKLERLEHHLPPEIKTIIAQIQLQPSVQEKITEVFPIHTAPSILADGPQLKHTADESERKPNSFLDLLGLHPLLTEARTLAAKLAVSRLPVFIEGETGTGKRSFARAMHTHSEWSGRPFLAVNCSTLTAQELNRMLAGDRQGCTLFLDEAGELTPETQAILAAYLQKNEAVTGDLPDIRFISSSSSNMKEKVRTGHFRADLYYRLNAAPLWIPALRDRKSDIPLLMEAFFNEMGMPLDADAKVMDTLMKEEWEGNIRELKNTAAYLAAISGGEPIRLHDLPGKANVKKTKKKEPSPLPLTMMDKKEFAFILDSILRSNENGEPSSRRIISEMSKIGPVPLTAQQVRHRLDYLEKNQYVTKGRGRAGTKITVEGMDFLHSLKSHLTSS